MVGSFVLVQDSRGFAVHAVVVHDGRRREGLGCRMSLRRRAHREMHRLARRGMSLCVSLMVCKQTIHRV